mmetsp:Transcript_38305/g.88560  ORF Transcript_38305/g.88560 Transcript_38305/m.88560 type:complete len:223 (+) Transcript_38305:467-1135(+)
MVLKRTHVTHRLGCHCNTSDDELLCNAVPLMLELGSNAELPHLIIAHLTFSELAPLVIHRCFFFDGSHLHDCSASERVHKPLQLPLGCKHLFDCQGDGLLRAHVVPQGHHVPAVDDGPPFFWRDFVRTVVNGNFTSFNPLFQEVQKSLLVSFLLSGLQAFVLPLAMRTSFTLLELFLFLDYGLCFVSEEMREVEIFHPLPFFLALTTSPPLDLQKTFTPVLK